MSLWAFRFILWHICVYLVQPQQRFPFLISFNLGDLTFFLAAAFHVMDCGSQNKPFIRFGPATRLALILMFWAWMANMFGAYQGAANWNITFSTIVKNCLVVIMLEVMVHTPQRALGVLMTLGATSLWWFKAGVRGIQAGGTYQDSRIMGPAVGLVQGPNEFGIFMVVIMILCLGLYYIAEKKSWWKWVFLALALTSVFIVLQTGSRAGLLGLGVFGLLYLPRLFRTGFSALLLIPLVLYFAVLGIDEKNKERFMTIPNALINAYKGVPDKPYEDMNQDERSAEDRRLKNRDTWALIKEHPVLGAGLNPQVWNYPDRFEWARGTVHNELLLAGRQMGMPGMALLIVMYAWIVRTGARTQRLTKTSWPEVSSMAWMCGMMSLLLFFGGLFSTFVWNLLLMTLLAVTSQLKEMSQSFKKA